MILDEVGNVISRTDYTAFGEIRNQTAASPTDYQYTGQRSYMDDFGLHYYVARWYDPHHLLHNPLNNQSTYKVFICSWAFT